MTLEDQITSGVEGVLTEPWDIREGEKVPTTDTVALKNGAVKVDATYLYADLGDSSSLAQQTSKQITAKVIRAYLNVASRIIRHFEGEIRSFDGDRVMGIYMGKRKNGNACEAALVLNWSFERVIKPRIFKKWPSVANNWSGKHGIGIATGETLIVRGGVRLTNNNDLVSIGDAPNVAAKLSDLRDRPIHITQTVYGRLPQEVKISSTGKDMWSVAAGQTIGGKTFDIRASSWRRPPK